MQCPTPSDDAGGLAWPVAACTAELQGHATGAEGSDTGTRTVDVLVRGPGPEPGRRWRLAGCKSRERGRSARRVGVHPRMSPLPASAGCSGWRTVARSGPATAAAGSTCAASRASSTLPGGDRGAPRLGRVVSYVGEPRPRRRGRGRRGRRWRACRCWWPARASDWDGEALMVTPADSPTGRNLAATRAVRLVANLPAPSRLGAR